MLSLLQLHSATLAGRPVYKVKDKGLQMTVWGCKLEMSITRRETVLAFQSQTRKSQICVFQMVQPNRSSGVKTSCIFHYGHGLQVSKPYLQMPGCCAWRILSSQKAILCYSCHPILKVILFENNVYKMTSEKKKAILFYSKFHKIKF